MRAVQITRFGGPMSSTSSTCPPTPGEGQQRYEVSAAGVNHTDAHQRLS